jgi:chitosanase
MNRPPHVALVVCAVAGGVLLACGAGGAPPERTRAPNTPASGASRASEGAAAPSASGTFGCDWTLPQQELAWATTSVFENNTTVIQYPYCENISDGRGYTSGRAGFCTGTADAIQVVQCYDDELAKRPELAPRNLMAKYVKGLAGLTGADTRPVDQLGSYCADWTKSATDPATAPFFKGCQDHVAMTLYQTPACKAARSWGATSPLFFAELYDAWVNHGTADDLLAAAGKQTGIRATGAPLSRADESALLHAFLTLRLDVLRKDSTWALDVDRVAPYEAARRAGNFDFSGTIDTGAKSAVLWPGLNLVDSKAPVCKLSLVGAGDGAKLHVTGDPACTASVIATSLPGHGVTLP